MTFPLRCPKCHALVVDRRSAVCTTCRAALPEGWAMTPQQTHKVEAIDQDARQEHTAAMKSLNLWGDPDTPILFRQIPPTV